MYTTYKTFFRMSSGCSHVAAILFKIEQLHVESCTSKSCKWDIPKVHGKPERVKDMDFKHHRYSKQGMSDGFSIVYLNSGGIKLHNAPQTVNISSAC